MGLPGVNVVIRDFALGLIGDTDSPQVKVGTAQKGPLNTVVSISDPDTLKSTYGSGPLVEAAAHALVVGGGPVFCCRVAASNVGVAGSVTLDGSGLDPGAGSTGDPLDAYEVQVKIVAGGAVGTATFQVSFDGGDNFSPVYVTAATVATFATETGLTLTFATGSYVAGDVYSFTCSAPTYSSSDLATGLDAIKATPFDFDCIHVVGTVGGANDAGKVTNFAALAAAVETKLTAMETAGRYTHAILEVPVVADSALAVSAVTSFVSVRQTWVAGEVELISGVTARSIRRHAGVPYAARLSKIALQRSPGAVADGTLPGVVKLYRDERVTEALDALRITTLRTYDSAAEGFFVTNGRMMAATGSDFTFVQRRRVMDRACKIVRAEALRYVNTDLAVDPETGRIDELEAKAIESDVNSPLQAGIVSRGFASGAEVQLNRTDNLLSTETLRLKVRVIPKINARSVDLDIGFKNPLLEQAA